VKGITPKVTNLVGSIIVNDDTTLQTVGSSIYNYVISNQIVGYETFKLVLSGKQIFPDYLKVPDPKYVQYWRLPEGMNMEAVIKERGRFGNNNVSLLLPNDIYVSAYRNLKIKDLPRLMGGLDLSQPLRADIEQELNLGLGKYIYGEKSIYLR
jgi:hypothetical protein